MTAAPTTELPARWERLDPHLGQSRLWRSKSRFAVIPCGRRSGKSEIAKRKLALEAIRFHAHPDGMFIYAAPTHAQAKKIAWKDLKALTRPFWLRQPSESNLEIYLLNGATIMVLGMDRPERAEGFIIDGCILDEYGNMRADVWKAHLRPALSTLGRPGWCWFPGTPEGLNHYYDLVNAAIADETGEWSHHHWPSWDILEEDEVEAARREFDELHFRQEYGGEFVAFGTRVYRTFDRKLDVKPCAYDPGRPLVVCADFNVRFISWTLCQEYRAVKRSAKGDVLDTWPVVRAIDELCMRGKTIEEAAGALAYGHRGFRGYGAHEAGWRVYPDSSGVTQGNRQTGKTDVDALELAMREAGLDDVWVFRSKANPRVQHRVTATNAFIQNTRGLRRLEVDPKCAELIKDFEKLEWQKNGRDIQQTEERSHSSDGFGYYIWAEHRPSGFARTTADDRREWAA